MFELFDFMPEAASSWAGSIDWINNFITNVSVFCILAITGMMVLFGIKYRRRTIHDETPYITHNAALETLWTAVPTFVCIFVFYYGYVVYADMRTPPASAMEVTVEGYQWGWNYQYANGKKTSAALVVPVDTPVRLVMRSKDVNHSFFIPSMRVKEDLMASMYTYLWFTPIKIGDFPIFCAEYCGLSHSYMRSTLKVVSAEAFQDFLNDRTAKELTPAEKGAAKFAEKGCVACHSIDGSAMVGPSLKGVFGREQTFTDGSKVKADENYLKESILNSNAKIVKGFAPAMPAFQGQLSDDDVDVLIAYLKTL